MKLFVMFTWTFAVCHSKPDPLDKYRDRIIFTAFTKSQPNGIVTHFDDTLETFDCDPKGNATFVVHGWLESIDRPWAVPMINEFLKLRGNCVFFMDYSVYTLGSYGKLTPHFYRIADVLVEKILKTNMMTENLVMFGFSFGARLVTRAGWMLGNSKVDRIYACDPAGPGFDPLYMLDPKKAAKFVACIHTSNTYGTKIYNCHQDWRLGVCGLRQTGSMPFPYGSHGLCPYFFLASFNEDFVPNNIHRCKSFRTVRNPPKDLLMGPRETRLNHRGDIFAPTAKNPPWSGNPNKRTPTEYADFFEAQENFGKDYYIELFPDENEYSQPNFNGSLRIYHTFKP